MSRTWPYALAIVVLVSLAAPRAIHAGEPDIAGIYVSQGVNPDGTEYRGFVHIARLHESLVVRWMFLQEFNGTMQPVPAAVGIGIVSGSALAVSYYGAAMVGVAVYRIEDNGQRLVGQWAAAGDDGTVNVETLTRVREDKADPSVADPPADAAPADPKRRVVPAGGLSL